MELAINIAVVVLTLFVLILVHEGGHFAIAKLCRIDVDRFAIGFGKPIFKYRSRAKTEYVFAPILIGGYLKINEQSFARTSCWLRMLVMAGGVAANLLFAVVMFWLLFSIGIKTAKPVIAHVVPNSIVAQANIISGETIYSVDKTPVNSWQDISLAIFKRMGDADTMRINGKRVDLKNWKITNGDSDPLLSLGIEPFLPKIPNVIAKITPFGPAAKIGLKAGDRVLKINAQTIASWHVLIKYIQQHPNQEITLAVLRNNKVIKLTGKIGSKIAINLKQIGFLGIYSSPVKWPQQMLKKIKYPVNKAFTKAVTKTWQLLAFNFIILGKIIIGKVSLKVLGGPIAIISAVEFAFKEGVLVFINFLGLFSIMLAFVNMLPIPVLDGGNFVVLLVEAISGKQFSESTLIVLQKIGALILTSLIFIAVVNDILRLFS